MANSHPYISGAGNIAQMISHLRKSFPQNITSETVKKLGIASKNESYVINALQFVKIIDEEGKKTTEAGKVFSHHKNDEFMAAFSELIQKAYSGLFDLHGENSWDLGNDELITFFRQSDQTSDAIGKRQAATFKTFAGLSGHGELPTIKAPPAKPEASAQKKTKALKPKNTQQEPYVEPLEHKPNKRKEIGLTVRVEINLPADGTKETYDNIFKSNKEPRGKTTGY